MTGVQPATGCSSFHDLIGVGGGSPTLLSGRRPTLAIGHGGSSLLMCTARYPNTVTPDTVQSLRRSNFVVERVLIR